MNGVIFGSVQHKCSSNLIIVFCDFSDLIPPCQTGAHDLSLNEVAILLRPSRKRSINSRHFRRSLNSKVDWMQKTLITDKQTTSQITIQDLGSYHQCFVLFVIGRYELAYLSSCVTRLVVYCLASMEIHVKLGFRTWSILENSHTFLCTRPLLPVLASGF